MFFLFSENFNTCRLFLDPENREKALSLFPCNNDEEKENVNKWLTNMNIILHVTNTIGEIRVQKFSLFVKAAHKHMLDSFGHFQHVKNSCHWTLAHIGELLRMNKGYSLAEHSENSLEASIKKYRYVTQNLSRNTSFVENSEDSLRVLFVQSLYRIRQHQKKLPKAEKKMKDDPESIEIISFFKNIDEESGNIIKWKSTELDQRFDLLELNN